MSAALAIAGGYVAVLVYAMMGSLIFRLRTTTDPCTSLSKKCERWWNTGECDSCTTRREARWTGLFWPAFCLVVCIDRTFVAFAAPVRMICRARPPDSEETQPESE